MLPGGLNGGVKPAIFEFIRALQNLPNPRFEFCFITAHSTHGEIEAIAGARDDSICLDSDKALGTLPRGFFSERRVDILYAPFGMIRFLNCGIPIVAMVVDLLHRDYSLSISEEEKHWREKYFSQMISYADRFQVISDYTGERLIRHYGIAREKVFRTYLPIQDRLQVTEAARQPEKHFFFYPANFWPHKNHDVLLIAYQIYRHQAGPDAWDLVLTGGDDSRKLVLQQLAISLGIEDHVTFKGHISDKELARYFSSASALVFPSLHEGFGIPAVEAMRLGVPVLASDAGSLREVIGEAGLLVDSRKPLELAAAMYEIARSEEWRNELRRRGFKRAQAFSLEAEVARLATAFAEVLMSTKKITLRGHLRRRFALLRAENAIRSQAAVEKIYRFLRDRI
jgi:glycosyltransferase involved in cell wall biosynthesis